MESASMVLIITEKKKETRGLIPHLSVPDAIDWLSLRPFKYILIIPFCKLKKYPDLSIYIYHYLI
jgi:hypothetical protein